nr:reverse transcriptase domain-containing protein [Tanacetum cinerariifolium]
MSTRPSARNLFSPLDNPELTIQRRSRFDPTLLNDFEMAIDKNGDPLVLDLRTMEELCQATLNGRGGPIVPIAIQAMNFGLMNDMIQLVQNSCQFHGLSSDDAKKHLDKFFHVTQSIKNDCLATVGQTQNEYAARAYNQGGNSYQPQGSGTLPSNTITNPKEDLKGITTRSGTSYTGPTIPTTSSPPKVAEQETDVTKDTVPPSNNRSTKDVQPLVVQVKTPIPNSKPIVAPVLEPVVAPVKLSPMCMTLELADRSISHPIGVAEDVFVKVGTFHFPSNFVVVNFDANPRVPLILERSFLKIGRALIDVDEGELTLRVGKEAVTFNLDQTLRYSANYDAIDFLLEVTDAFLSIDDEPISPKINKAYYDSEGDILLLEEFLNDDLSSPPLPPQELKDVEPTNEKSSIDEPPVVKLKDLPPHLEYAFFKDKMLKRCEDTNLCLNWEKSHFRVKEGIVLDHKISKNMIEVDKAKVDVITKLPHPTTVKGIRSFLEHVDFYRQFIQDFLKIARSMTRLLEKDTPFFFSKECVKAFQTLKKKLFEAPILVMLKYGVTHRLAIAYHPQTSGQVEVSNRGLKRILERTMGENRASWSDKLDDALWVFRAAFKTPSGCTPNKLVYRACHLPIELKHKAYWALKNCNYDLLTVGDHRKVQLNELNEIRNQAYENSLIYKEKTKRIHDSKIKDRVFNIGDRVLLFNSRLKIFSGKLKTHWSGPFTITQVFPYGTVELSQTDGLNFKVNGHRLKHYFGEDIPKMVVPNL